MYRKNVFDLHTVLFVFLIIFNLFFQLYHISKVCPGKVFFGDSIIFIIKNPSWLNSYTCNIIKKKKKVLLRLKNVTHHIQNQTFTQKAGTLSLLICHELKTQKTFFEQQAIFSAKEKKRKNSIFDRLFFKYFSFLKPRNRRKSIF